MKQPTISIIMPNYNHGQYLERSLGAFASQSVQPTELVIVDDGSTDNSVEIISAIAAKNPFIKFYRNEKNMGGHYTVNRAIELSTGEYLYFAAADDEVLPGFIERTSTILAQYPQAALCYCVNDMVEVETGLNWHLGVGAADAPCYFSPEEMIKLEQKRKLFMSCNAAIFRRKCLAEAGWFMPELKWHCDWFGVNIPAYRYGVCYVPEALTRFFILPNSYFKAGRRNEAAHREALEALMERLTRPEYANECELIRRAGSLYQFGGPMRSILWRNKNYRKFLTPVFLRNNLWYSTKLFLKKFTPAWAGNLYFKFAGYRAKPAKKA